MIISSRQLRKWNGQHTDIQSSRQLRKCGGHPLPHFEKEVVAISNLVLTWLLIPSLLYRGGAGHLHLFQRVGDLRAIPFNEINNSYDNLSYNNIRIQQDHHAVI